MKDETYKNTITHPAPNHIPRHKQPRTSRGTIIIHIIDGNLRHPKLIEDALPTSRVTIAVASNALFDIVVVDMRVKHGFYASFETKFCVINFATRFNEFGHAYAEDVDGFELFLAHFCD